MLVHRNMKRNYQFQRKMLKEIDNQVNTNRQPIVVYHVTVNINRQPIVVYHITVNINRQPVVNMHCLYHVTNESQFVFIFSFASRYFCINLRDTSIFGNQLSTIK